MDLFLLSERCRVCIKLNNRKRPLFSSESRGIVQKLTYCTGLQFMEEEGLPSHICLSCLDALIVAYNFKTSCVNSDAIFRKMVPSKVKKEPDLKSDKGILNDFTFWEGKKIKNALNTNTFLNLKMYKGISIKTIKAAPEPPKPQRGRPSRKGNRDTAEAGANDDAVMLVDSCNSNDEVQIDLDPSKLVETKMVDAWVPQIEKRTRGRPRKSSLTVTNTTKQPQTKRRRETPGRTKIDENDHSEEKVGEEHFADGESLDDDNAKITLDGVPENDGSCTKSEFPEISIVIVKDENTISEQKTNQSGDGEVKVVDEHFDDEQKNNQSGDGKEKVVNEHFDDEQEFLDDEQESLDDKQESLDDFTEKIIEKVKHKRGPYKKRKHLKTTIKGTTAIKNNGESNKNNQSNRNTSYRKNMSRKPLHCDVCNIKFPSGAECAQHMKTHESSRVCEVCGIYLNTSYPYSVRSHMKCHAAVRKACDYCGYSTPYKRDLANHIRNVHLGIRKMYQCQYCAKSYGWSSGLAVHIQRVHQKITRFACDRCGHMFYDKTQYLRHCDSHNLVRRYKCFHCPSSYSRLETWKKHLLDRHAVEIPPGQKGRRARDQPFNLFNKDFNTNVDEIASGLTDSKETDVASSIYADNVNTNSNTNVDELPSALTDIASSIYSDDINTSFETNVEETISAQTDSKETDVASSVDSDSEFHVGKLGDRPVRSYRGSARRRGGAPATGAKF